jgi:hypothetical protein
MEDENARPTFQEFWKSHCKELPKLAEIVKTYAIMCSTSIYSESSFSQGGITIGKQRQSMQPETVRYCTQLRDKFDLFENLQINIQDYM